MGNTDYTGRRALFSTAQVKESVTCLF